MNKNDQLATQNKNFDSRARKCKKSTSKRCTTKTFSHKFKKLSRIFCTEFSEDSFISVQQKFPFIKGLKFVPTANKIDQAKLKRELEEYGRKVRLKWHLINDERPFSQEKSKPKSTFNPRNKDVLTEIYLSCLEERLLDIEIPSKRFSNFT